LNFDTAFGIKNQRILHLQAFMERAVTYTNEIDLLEAARSFAASAHARMAQTYGKEPYTVHLDAVVSVLRRFPTERPENQTILEAAGYLHDVIEDCDVSSEVIRAMFGVEISTLVSAVTNEPGANRTERSSRTYPKIKKTPYATRLKLADRIANMEACIEERDRGGSSPLLNMYKKEYPAFREALFEKAADTTMWDHLDVLVAI
jgi:(p)ppGpp synthase/HD superfamily hydrolase